jgi:uncharacterized protein YjbI with pentapeptide repeats
MESANFSEASLYDANLNESYCFKTKFEKADLRYASFDTSIVTFGIFTRANLSEAYLRDSNFNSSDFRGANITITYAEVCNFGNANFSSADLRFTSFASSDLAWSNLLNAKLTGTNFQGTNVYAARVSYKSKLEFVSRSGALNLLNSGSLSDASYLPANNGKNEPR